jgi:HEAT repeat protein
MTDPAGVVPQDPASGPVDPAPADPGSRPVGDETPGPARPVRSPLLSPETSRRREALVRLHGRPLRAAEASQVAGVLASDPDPSLRRLAVRALAGAPTLSRDLVERGLRDPDDGVRAAMVREAARRGYPDLPELLDLALARSWPLAQRTALEALPLLITRLPEPDESVVDAFLVSVAALDPPPLESERPGLSQLAEAFGIERLASRLGGPPALSRGAVRLLLAERSPHSLRLVAAVDAGADPELRQGARDARRLLGPAYDAAPAPGAIAESAPSEDELIAVLAMALRDPDERVRSRAASSLGRVPSEVLTAWAERTLAAAGGDRNETLAANTRAEPSTGDAILAASVVAAIGVPVPVRALLPPAAQAATADRAPFLAALHAVRPRPEELAAAAISTPRVHRAAAVDLAWTIGGRAVLPHLAALLQDPSGAVRSAVLDAMAASDDPSALAAAANALSDDPSAPVRATAIHALARGSVEERVASLAQALTDPDPDVRAVAVEQLSPGIEGPAGNLLLEALGDDDERVWRASLRQLAALPPSARGILWTAIRVAGRERREALIEALVGSDPDVLTEIALAGAHSPDPTDRALAVQIGAHSSSPAATAVVTFGLEDPDPSVRRAAATAIARMRLPDAVPALTRSLSDPQADVRVEAVRALGMVDDGSVLEVLISALQDPEGRVRAMAAEALLRWRSPSVARTLAGHLGTPDLRRPVGEVLVRMGETAIEPLVRVLMDGDPETASAAASILGSVSGAERFVAGLSSRDPEVRLRSVRVLGALGGPEASEALLGALTDPDQRVRNRSVALLGSLGDPRAVGPLRQVFLTDPVAEVASTAEQALRMLGHLPPRQSSAGSSAEAEEPSSEPNSGPQQEP